MMKNTCAPIRLMRSRRIDHALALTLVLLCYGSLSRAEPDQHTTPAPAIRAVEQASPTSTDGDKIADAIASGLVLKGMTMAQVVSARGEPTRKELIPPDAALWHYDQGQVAFFQGKVSYTELEALPVSPAVNRQLPVEQHTQPTQQPSTSNIATVDTPGDGFLALRSEPTIRQGRRLLKIPHRSVLRLEECVSPTNSGRWCRTTFQGQVGWVFERYLVW